VLVYLDSNIVIYLIEQRPDFGPRASAQLAEMEARNDQLVVSDLTRLECRFNPMPLGDHLTLQLYDEFFARSEVQVIGLTTAVCDRATEIRAQRRIKTPDALHLAAAMEAGCDMFLTNDLRLATFPGLTVEILKDASPPA
jgi:predicted nucleic acid-binding protein